jgi:hypothetical protein
MKNNNRTLLALLLLVTVVCVEQLPAREITHRVIVQPIVARDDNGLHPAKCNIEETLIDQVYGGIGIDFYFLKTVYYDSNDVLKGKKDVNIIVDDARKTGLLKGNGQIINLFFVDCINGKPAPRGLGQQPGWLVFIAMGKDVPEGQDAFVVGHECAHNLGLGHAVDDPNVPDDIPNLMGDGPFIDRVGPEGLTDYQATTIYKSPLVKPFVDCLDRDSAAKAITDESVEPYFSILQRREISALLGQSLPSDWTLEQCRDKVKRDFQAVTLDFTKEERQNLTQIAAKITAMLKKDFPLFAHQPWRFIKVKNDHCGGMAYTRSDCIILNQRMLAQICKAGKGSNKAATLQRRTSLLVHEQLHVLQRFYPDRFAPLYEGTWGFQRGQVTPNTWLNKHQITNPDAPATDWITECTTDQGTRQLLWMRTLIMGTGDVPRLGRDFEAVAVHLEKNERGFYAICDPNGKPVYEPMSRYSEYVERFCSAAKRGLDHPHEIAAYAFAELFLNEYVQTEPSREEPDQQAFWNSFRYWSRTHLD